MKMQNIVNCIVKYSLPIPQLFSFIKPKDYQMKKKQPTGTNVTKKKVLHLLRGPNINTAQSADGRRNTISIKIF